MTSAAPARPTSSLMRVRLCGAALVALLALVAVGCGGGGGTGVTAAPISVRELAKSAATSADARSGRFSVSFEASSPDTNETFVFGGEGAFDEATKQARFSFDLGSLAKLMSGIFGNLPRENGPDFDDPSQWQLDVIQDGDVAFMRFPAADGRLPNGKSWVRLSGATSPSVQGSTSGNSRDSPRATAEACSTTFARRRARLRLWGRRS
jgi:hypothetical protein